MIRRTFYAEGFSQACEQVRDMAIGYGPEAWIANTDNVVLTDGEGSYALFERTGLPHVVIGHYLLQARGKDALRVSREMLDKIFSDKYGVEIIQGFTPLSNLGARWISKKLGFTSHGVVHEDGKPFEYVMLTKQDWSRNG